MARPRSPVPRACPQPAGHPLAWARPAPRRDPPARSAPTEAATPSRRRPPTRSRHPQARRERDRRAHPPQPRPQHRAAQVPPTRKATPPDAPEHLPRSPRHPRTRATPPASGTISGCTSTPSWSASSSSPHCSSRRNGSTANAEAQQLRTAAATSSRPTPVTEENAPAHRASPSSGLDDRTITRPPSPSTAKRNSSTSAGSSVCASTATRPAATPFARTAATPAPIALSPNPPARPTQAAPAARPAVAAPNRAALTPMRPMLGTQVSVSSRASGGVANGVVPVATASLPGPPPATHGPGSGTSFIRPR